MQSAVASTEWPCLTFAIGAAVIRKVINPKDTIPSRPSADSAARRSIAPASARHRLFGRFYHRRTSKRQQDRDHHRCRRWQGLIGTAGLRMTVIDLYFELVPHSAMAAKLTRTKVGRWASQRLQSSASMLARESKLASDLGACSRPSARSLSPPADAGPGCIGFSKVPAPSRASPL